MYVGCAEFSQGAIQNGRDFRPPQPRRPEDVEDGLEHRALEGVGLGVDLHLARLLSLQVRRGEERHHEHQHRVRQDRVRHLSPRPHGVWSDSEFQLETHFEGGPR